MVVAKNVLQPSHYINTREQTNQSRIDDFINDVSWKRLLKTNFGKKHFVAVFAKLGGKVPVVDKTSSSHEQQLYHNTLLNENRIEFDFELIVTTTLI